MRQVKVQYIFSNRELKGAQAIIWGTKHQYPNMSIEKIPSHGAVLIDSKWVFESTLDSGVRVMGYKEWSKINNEVAKIDCTATRYYEDIKAMFKESKGKKYDWFGVLYLGFHLALNKAFGKKIPKKNLLHSENKYFCLEVIGKMTGLDYQMSTPVQVMEDLLCCLE